MATGILDKAFREGGGMDDLYGALFAQDCTFAQLKYFDNTIKIV